MVSKVVEKPLKITELFMALFYWFISHCKDVCNCGKFPCKNKTSAREILQM